MNVFVRSLPLLLLSFAGLMSVQESSAQSVATSPVGYNMFTLPSGYSLRVNTFVLPTAFQGNAASITNAANSVITVSSSSGTLTSGSYNETGSEPSYYVEILSTGTAQGLIADVISNTATTVTVDTNLVSFAVSGTTSFCIRPHTTLSSMFPVATSGLTAGQDTVSLFLANSVSPTLFDYTGSGTGWINATAGGTPAGSQIVYPGQGFLIYVQNAKSVPVTGCVKSGQTQVPLYAGAINLVGTFNPVLSGTQTLSNFSFPASLQPGGDFVEPFVDNGLLQSAGEYVSNGTNMVSSGGNADGVQINASNSVLVYVNSSKNWIMPSFYTYTP
jgi:hypothetical protein